MNSSDINRRRHATVDISMTLVGFLLVGGKRGDAGGVGGLDNGVKVKSDGVVGFFAEVGEVEGDAGGFTLNAGYELADLNLVFDSIDEHHIIGIGMIDVDTGVELEFHMQSIDAATGKLHPGDRASGEQQARKVDMYHTVVVGETMLVDTGELVVLDMPVGVGLFGKSTLDDGAEDGGGVLHGLEECTLPQLCFRLVVGERFSLAATELLAETGIEDTVANGASLLNEGWFHLCHSIPITKDCAFYYIGMSESHKRGAVREQ